MSILTPIWNTPEADPFRENPFWWWQGRSGLWYIHTVFGAGLPLPQASANYIFVRRNWDGSRSPIYIGQSGAFADRFERHEKWVPALALGANEVHVHLLADSERVRFGVESDLRGGHWTPLNEQATPDVDLLWSLDR